MQYAAMQKETKCGEIKKEEYTISTHIEIQGRRNVHASVLAQCKGTENIYHVVLYGTLLQDSILNMIPAHANSNSQKGSGLIHMSPITIACSYLYFDGLL